MKHALTLLLVIACSHPPKHAREPDDDRGGAIKATSMSADTWNHSGSLSRYDAVDWLRIDLPAEPGSINIRIDSDGSVAAEVYAADGTELAKVPAKITAGTLIYVRVAGTSPRYTLYASRGPVTEPTPPPPIKLPECDRENFDARRPECKDKCDFKNPDENLQDCCLLWWTKCTHYQGDRCRSQTLWWIGDQLQAAMGFENGVHGHPRAVLYLDAREPELKDKWMQFRRGKTIELRALNIEATRSEWTLSDPDAHDFDWLRKHAKTIEVFVPINCPRGKPRER